MRIIETKMLAAVAGRRPFSLDNTAVSVNTSVFDASAGGLVPASVAVYLHGNLIAYYDAAGVMHISCGGWHSRTTASRLRAIGANIRIKDGRIIDSSTGEEILHTFKPSRRGWGF